MANNIRQIVLGIDMRTPIADSLTQTKAQKIDAQEFERRVSELEVEARSHSMSITAYDTKHRRNQYAFNLTYKE